MARQSNARERQELVQLAVEELMEKDGKIPSCRRVATALGRVPDCRTTRQDWDFLHEQGKLPPRPKPKLPQRLREKEGGVLFLEAEALLRFIGAEIVSATPEYQAAAREFWVTHLDAIVALAEKALKAAMGSTVDDLIDQINEKGK